MKETDIIATICTSSEFNQIQVGCFYNKRRLIAAFQCREAEMRDLDELVSYGCALRLKGGNLATPQGKTNCLLQVTNSQRISWHCCRLFFIFRIIFHASMFVIRLSLQRHII